MIECDFPGNIGKACDILRSLNGSQHRPGLVSTLVALYTGMENEDSAIGVLDEAVDWYKEHGVCEKKYSP